MKVTFALVLMVVATVAPMAHATGLRTCHRARYPEDCQLPTRVVTVGKADGFDWADAGIGAGSALGAVFVAAGLGSLFRRPARALT
jgi:hypothetical protein